MPKVPIKIDSDPIISLLGLGCENLYDYRFMDYNLIKNFANPSLDLGANILSYGDFEAPYTAGVANGWNWVGTGTPTEETSLPWDSPGTSAQRITNDTKYGGFILSSSMTGSFIRHQTYQIKFKIKVESGYARIRVTCYNSPFEVAAMRDFGPGSEGEFVVYGACGRNPATAISMQIYNIGTSTPLTMVIDDLTVKPVQNDTHVYIDSQNFDQGAWDGRGYQYNSGGYSYAKNWNRTGQIAPGSEHTFFSLLEPDSNCYTMQSMWNAADSDKSFTYKLWSPINGIYSNISSDGSAAAAYQETTVDPHAISKLVVLNEYNGAGGTEAIRVNGQDCVITYPSGSHYNSLHSGAGVPYMHASLISSSGTYIERGDGLFSVMGFFDRILTESEKQIVETSLLYLR